VTTVDRASVVNKGQDNMSKEIVAPRLNLKPPHITALIGNTATNAGAIGYWDMWLTMSGGEVFAPVHMDKDFQDAEVRMADFAQTVKIQKSDALIVIIDDSDRLEEFMIPLIHFALAKRIPVYTSEPLKGIEQESCSLTSTQLLRPLNMFPLNMLTLVTHLDYCDKNPKDAGGFVADDGGMAEDIDWEKVSVGEAVKQAAKEPATVEPVGQPAVIPVPPTLITPMSRKTSAAPPTGIATPPKPAA
jgi:hypothetical protein